ncbi:MAG: hypothetical protein Q8Q95_02355 [bacterium]|nr:hypothetical protein [bacterium]
MAIKLNKNKTGLAVGLFMGLWHAVWSLLVSADFAQRFLDMVYGLHFLNNPHTVSAFMMVNAVKLIVFTAVMGYVIGFVFAFIWNKGHGRD